MAIILPTLPRLADVDPRLIDNSGRLIPSLGGPSQTISRLGNRYAVDISNLTVDAVTARLWLAAQLRAKTEGQTVRLVWPQADADADAMPSAAVVDGAGQTGSALAIRGLGAGAVLPPFSFFSFIVSGRAYLHATSAEATADGTGRAVVPIGPMLRTSPADGAALNFAAPVIEGDLDPGPLAWSLRRLTWTGVSFSITENE